MCGRYTYKLTWEEIVKLYTPFAFAGVYDIWNADGKSAITRFSILTTAAAPSTAAYHDRMPVVLEESQFEDWMRQPPEASGPDRSGR